MGADIDKLKARADKANSGVKLEYYEKNEALKEKHPTAKDKLNGIKNASDDAWQYLKTGLEAAWVNLSNALKKATSHFK